MSVEANSWRIRHALYGGVLVLGLAAGNTQAAFQVIDDFDLLTLGNVDSQNGWVDAGDSGQVVADPDGSANQVLRVSTDSGVLRHLATIPEGASGTLFMRFRFSEHGRYSLGLSHLTSPTEYSDFGPELGMASATASDPNDELQAASADTGIYEVLETLSPDTWYNTWIQVDTQRNSYRVWLNQDAGGAADPLADALDDDSGATEFDFRVGTNTDLLNFYIKTGGGSSSVQGAFYLDDIYLLADRLSLRNPTVVPLPASFGLLMAAALTLRRRRRVN